MNGDYTSNTSSPIPATLKQRFEQLDGDRRSVLTRTELYASWTLPYICPPLHVKQDELQSNLDSLGARATNHLSNKIAETTFTPYRPFFKLELTEEMQKELNATGQPEKVGELMTKIDTELSYVERQSMRRLEKMGYRTAAVLAIKHLIITGNALIYHPPGGKAQVYDLRNYCIVRDISGTFVEIVMRDCKAFETFSADVQQRLLTAGAGRYKPGLHQDVTIYTRVTLEADGKYHVKQAAENVDLGVHEIWPVNACPWIALTWNLLRGENYGRGLVEDFAGAFHAITMLTQALVEGAAIAADIKFLVNPASSLDIEELNKAASGSYHYGREGDITSPEVKKQNDFNMANALIERFTREISQAFLLMQGTTRDAERVTALEIRRDAQELESSLGGIYSRLAEEWQNPLARLLLDRQKFQIGGERAIEPVIITGMDSLSRGGELDNIQLFLGDLALLDQVPEEFRARIDATRFMQVIGAARAVDYNKFLKTPEQLAADQQQAMAQQRALMQAQAGADVQAEVGKQVAKEP